ncbi:MAG: CpaD family pilus assembly protein [Sphingobium sp.]|nr:CpaD family pilus assembly protein [Sphingobium sp.]MCP5399537.1 CpaD family pilus assembly protein [Sphingomonas sp.]
MKALIHSTPLLRFGLMAAIALPLAACGSDTKFNRGMQSVHQPVVSYATFLYDVRPDGSSLSDAERARLIGWLDSLNVGYGDTVAIAANGTGVSPQLHDEIANVLGRRGMLIGEDNSALAGTPPYGAVRLILRRTSASVPGCPDWSRNAESDMVGGTSSNHGCAVNSNFAAMVANPEDLVRGQNVDSDLRTATSTRAIETYREKVPSGAGDLKSLGGN